MSNACGICGRYRDADPPTCSCGMYGASCHYCGPGAHQRCLACINHVHEACTGLCDGPIPTYVYACHCECRTTAAGKAARDAVLAEKAAGVREILDSLTDEEYLAVLETYLRRLAYSRRP